MDARSARAAATLRVGDAISATGAWGRAVRFGGVQFGTNFATQPTLVTTPLLAARGEAIVPSTVDVFINGQRVANETVPPGPFAIESLPAITGAGELQVVVTDALGRQQIVSRPYYSGPTLLRAGLNEYSVEAGAIREDYALESFAYGELFAAGTFRRGMTDLSRRKSQRRRRPTARARWASTPRGSSAHSAS